MLAKAETILKSTFGYSSFYPIQRDIIQSVLNKNDTLVVMPTGGGKSLCYQVPALVFEGLTVVISPLISLMKDQVDQLRELGVKAVFLNSSLEPKEYYTTQQELLSGKVKLLYLAPETLLKEYALNLLTRLNPSCFAIDEAHCISEWGHDFRPEYRQLHRLKELFPYSVRIALTATATQKVRSDIKAQLSSPTMRAFIASFNRPNLFLQAVPRQNGLRQTVDFLRKFPNESGIIYCFTRKKADELTEQLANLGFSVKPYHAGLSDKVRAKNQELFMKDDIQIIVATIAFGMGINKSNVRFVLHTNLPKSVESYYQQIGRAGRDGLPAQCLLLYSYGDIKTIQYFIDQIEDPAQRESEQRHIKEMLLFAESQTCRRVALMKYFGETHAKEFCGHCDNCTETKTDQVEITEMAKLFLTCVKQTGQSFGAHHLVNILRASKEKKLVQYGHDSLSVYGQGMAFLKEQWLGLSQQLVQQGYLEKDFERFGILKITAKGRTVLDDNQPVFGRLEAKSLPAIQANTTKSEYDQTLFEALRVKRKSFAELAGIPPYAVFHDSALAQMAQKLPTTRAAFLQISGVGNAKLEKYGDAFIRIIQNYLAENPDKNPPPELPPRARASIGIPRYQEV